MRHCANWISSVTIYNMLRAYTYSYALACIRSNSGAVEACGVPTGPSVRNSSPKGAGTIRGNKLMNEVFHSIEAAPSFANNNPYRGTPSDVDASLFPNLHSHHDSGAPVFSCGKVNPNYPIMPHGVVGLCVRAHIRQSATPFLQTNSSGPTTATDRDCPYTITTPTSNPRQNIPVLRRNRASMRRNNVRGCFFNQPLSKVGLFIINNFKFSSELRNSSAQPTGRPRVLVQNEASLLFKILHSHSPARSFLKNTFCIISGTANHEPKLSLTTKPRITARQGREHWGRHSQAPGPSIPGDRRSSTIAALRCQIDHCQPIPRFFDSRKREPPEKMSLA